MPSAQLTVETPPPQFKSDSKSNPHLLVCLLLTIAYVTCGKLGLMLALPPGYASPIFPPAGIAVAAMFIGGKRTLPWIFLGSLLLNIWVGYSAHHQVDTTGFFAASAIAAASTLQAFTGGWWLRRAIGYPAPLDRGRIVLLFLLLAPIFCLISATVSMSSLSIIGVVDAADFAANWATWWIGDTLGVIVTFPLVMIAFAEPRALWQSRIGTVAVPMMLIFALFVVIFLKSNQWERNDSLMEFRQLSQQVASQIQTQIKGQESLLEQMSGLFVHDTHNKQVTREEFHRFTEKSLTRFPMIQALEWVPRIDAADRTRFEAAQRKELPGFEIHERNSAGQLQRAGERTLFYPVTYIEPPADNAGFDLASTPDRLATLSMATASGLPTATAPFQLMQEHGPQTVILLLLPVKNDGNESGVVLAVLRMGDFMDKLLSATHHAKLYIRLSDLDEQKTIYDNFAVNAKDISFKEQIIFGTRRYQLETAPTPAYLAQHHGWQSWGVLTMGVLGTGLLGALLLLGTGYAARVEAQVDERTKELKRSKSRFKSTLENAPIGMAITSLDGQFMQVNHALCTILGYEKEELEKLTFREITHPEDIAATLACTRRLLDGEVNSCRLEKRYIQKNGQHVWTQITVSIERNESGAPLYFIGQVEDITERMQAETALRKSAQEIADLYNNAPCGYHSLDKDGVICLINDTELAWLGYMRDEVIGKIKWTDLLTSASIQTFRKNFPRLKKEGFVRDLEIEIIRKDGSVFTTLINATAIYDASGNYVMSRSTAFNITERKQAEDALRENESRLKNMFENLSSGVAVYQASPDGQNFIFTDFNRTAERIDNICREDVIGKNVEEVFPGIAEFGLLDVLHRVWKNGVAEHFPASFYQNGRIASWRDNYVYKLPQGEIVAIYDDVTKQKQAEEQMHQLAHYDALTGLPNRTLFADRIEHAITTAKRNKAHLAVIFIDLDRFKPVNDELGHDIGDLLLKEVAIRLENCVRESDTVSRIGGDEFVVLLPNIEAERNAMQVAEKILHAVSQPFELAGHRIRISASIGVAICPEHGDNENILIKNADIAMYCSKSCGRSNVKLYQPDMAENQPA